MKNRIPKYPGRIRLTPIQSQPNVFDMVRMDEPIEEGTPINKDTLLKDSTAQLLGLGADAVPDEALVKLRQDTNTSINNLRDSINASISNLEQNRKVHAVSSFQKMMTGGFR